MPATVRLGGLSSSYSSVLEAMRDANRSMKLEDLLNTTLDPNLTGFSSSGADGTPFSGIADQSFYFPWADNQTVFTLSPNTAENKQLHLAGVRAFASCKLKIFSVANLVPGLSLDSADPNTNDGSQYMLRRGNNCSDLGIPSTMACSAQYSLVGLA